MDWMEYAENILRLPEKDIQKHDTYKQYRIEGLKIQISMEQLELPQYGPMVSSTGKYADYSTGKKTSIEFKDRQGRWRHQSERQAGTSLQISGDNNYIQITQGSGANQSSSSGAFRLVRLPGLNSTG